MAVTNVKITKEVVIDKQPILIIDDESSIATTLKDALEDDGYYVLTASSGEEGIEKVKINKPFLVFLDMWMPVKDGLETLKEIIQNSPSTKVVMISGHATITNALEAMKAGAFDFLEKPFSLKNVNNVVNKAFHLSLLEDSQADGGIVRIDKIDNHQRISSTNLSSVHPSMNSNVKSGLNLGQRTIKSSIVLYGQCLHSGIKSGLVLEPLPLNSGIHFAHLGSEHTVPAFASNVQSTALATTLMSDQVSASTIEHLMAALSAYRISNLLVKCNGEVPIFDGSAKTFCDAIESTGIEEQGGEWYEFVPTETIKFSPQNSKNGEALTIEPSDDYIYKYELDYPEPVGKQTYEFIYKGPESFKLEISPARTFGFMKDVENMQRMGLAAGGRLNNFILIGNDGVVNTDLRFPEELVRHKILDLVGDISLLGRPIRAKFTARMTGHADNVGILKELLSKVPELIVE